MMLQRNLVKQHHTDVMGIVVDWFYDGKELTNISDEVLYRAQSHIILIIDTSQKDSDIMKIETWRLNQCDVMKGDWSQIE